MEKITQKIRFGITIPTYSRPDGVNLLSRAIDSVKSQTYKNWKLFVIGDRRETTVSLDRGPDFFYCNLSYAIGRDDGLIGMELWRVGGVGAMNFALTAQHLDKNIDVHCHLDDDDYWLPEHLETLAEQYNALNVSFVYTQTRRPYKNHDAFPKCFDRHVRDRLPEPNGLIHSSSSWRLSHVKSMYVPDSDMPADSDLWNRISGEIQRNKTISLFVPKVTVVREHSQKYVKWGENDKASK